MSSSAINKFAVIFLSVLVYIGFRFVTQAGQESRFQNDGYAVLGGLAILIAGFLLGYMYGIRRKK